MSKKSLIATLAGALLLGAGATGCASTTSAPADSSARSWALTSGTTQPTTAAARPLDYTRLLLKPADISIPGNTFSAQPPTVEPSGMDGVADLFTNQDNTEAIGDTILMFPDNAAAAAALNAARASVGKSVTGGNPEPAPVGAGSTTVSGVSPDQSKAVTMVLLTEGRALVRLEFDSAPDSPVPPHRVTDVAQKQDIAVRTVLAS